MKNLTKEQLQIDLEKENTRLKKLLGDMAAFSIASAAGQEHIVVDDNIIHQEHMETGRVTTQVMPDARENVVKPTLMAKAEKKVVDGVLSPIWQSKVDSCRARIKELKEQLATFEKVEDTPNM